MPTSSIILREFLWMLWQQINLYLYLITIDVSDLKLTVVGKIIEFLQRIRALAGELITNDF